MVHGYGWLDTAVHEYVHYLLTLRTGSNIQGDSGAGAVAVRGDTIVAVGKASDLRARYRATRVLGGERFVLTPGMVKSLQHRGLATLRRRLAQQGAYHPAEAA